MRADGVTLLLALLAGCASPQRPWTVTGADWPVDRIAKAAIEVTGDRHGDLAAGGVVVAHYYPDLFDALCDVAPGNHVSGCHRAGRVDVLVWEARGLGPAWETTALAHEFCHLGLRHGGGYSGPLVDASEPEADACGMLVVKEVGP